MSAAERDGTAEREQANLVDEANKRIPVRERGRHQESPDKGERGKDRDERRRRHGECGVVGGQCSEQRGSRKVFRVRVVGIAVLRFQAIGADLGQINSENFVRAYSLDQIPEISENREEREVG